MKGRWLLVAFSLISMGLMDEPVLRIIVGLLWSVVLYKEFRGKERLIGITILILFILLSIPLNNAMTQKGMVTQIRENYVLINSGLKRVIIYTDTSLRIGDVIELQGVLEPIEGINNFEVSTFVTYCRSMNIIGSLSIDEPVVLQHCFNFADLLYSHNVSTGNLWANSLLFCDGLSTSSSYSYLIEQCGMHISFLSGAFYSFFRLFFYKPKSRRVTLIAMSVLSVLFNFSYHYMRVLISLICKETFENKRDGCAFWIVTLCLIRPYSIRSLSFAIPVGIRILNLFISKKDSFVSTLWAMMMQLTFNGSADMLSSLLFPMLRTVFGGFYLLALFVSFLPFALNIQGILETLINLMDCLPHFEITGRLSLVMLIIMSGILLKMNEVNKRLIKIMVCVLLLMNHYGRLFCPYATVSWLDIGQGDCCVITVPFCTKALLIDTGGNNYKDVAQDTLIPYLKSQGIQSVEVIISHDDTDHSCALNSLCENFKVEKIYREKTETIPFEGLTIYNPLYECSYDNDNDNSLICYFSISDYTFLSLGDISERVEYDLLKTCNNLSADVCKLAHHGSASATSEKFLDNCFISFAVISAGRNNFYHHPSKEVTERLKTHQIEVLNTQCDHAIRFVVFSHFMIVLTSNQQLHFYQKIV